MKRILHAAVLAAVLAALIAWSWAPRGVDAEIVQLRLERELPAQAAALAAAPIDVKALMLDYAREDEVLAAAAWVALQRHPALAPEVLIGFGTEDSFREVLLDYGAAVVPPIHYFMSHDIASLTLRMRATRAADSLRERWRGEVPPVAAQDELTPIERGRQAILFIAEDGHGFLGQFELAADGSVAWVQTERVLEGLNSFFAGGVRRLETRVRRDEAVEFADVGWAALDLAVGVSAFKLLRMGRGAAASARGVSYTQRSAALGAGLLRGSAIGLRVARYGAPFALGYIALRHPSVLNALFGQLAEFAGLPVRVVQTLGWALVLLPVVWLMLVLLRPLAWLLGGVARCCVAADRRLARTGRG